MLLTRPLREILMPDCNAKYFSPGFIRIARIISPQTHRCQPSPPMASFVFGKVQVLFKVSEPPGSQLAEEKSYMLGAGQQADDIAVTRIDEKKP